MKKIVRSILVVLLVASAVFPISSQAEYPTLITDQALGTLYGGAEKVDCEAIALLVEASCYALGGGWLSCAIITAGAYLACLGANAL